MADQSSITLVSRQRALLAALVTALLLAFNYGSAIGSTADVATAAVGSLVVAYLTLTAIDFISDRFL